MAEKKLFGFTSEVYVRKMTTFRFRNTNVIALPGMQFQCTHFLGQQGVPHFKASIKTGKAMLAWN